MMITPCPSTLVTYLCTTTGLEYRWQNDLCEFLCSRKDVVESPECFCPCSCTPETPSVRSQVWSLILLWLGRDVLHPSGSSWGSLEESWLFQGPLRISGEEPREVMVASWNTGVLLHTLLLHHTCNRCWTGLKWKHLWSCLSQQEPYPESAEVYERHWLITEKLKEQLVRKQ